MGVSTVSFSDKESKREKERVVLQQQLGVGDCCIPTCLPIAHSRPITICLFQELASRRTVAVAEMASCELLNYGVFNHNYYRQDICPFIKHNPYMKVNCHFL